MFDIQRDQVFNPRDFLDDRIIDSLLARYPLKSNGSPDVTIIMNKALEYLRGKDEVRVSDLLDFVIPHMVESDFILKKNYTVRKSIGSIFGKWPQTYGNAFFTDSKFLLQDVIRMLRVNVQVYLKRNDFSQKDLDFVEQMATLMIKYSTEKSIDQFALNVMGHIDNRMHSYIYQSSAFDKVLNKIFEQIGLEAKINSETPILTNMEA